MRVAEAYGGIDGGALVLGSSRIEDHHLMILADFEDVGGLGLAHPVSLAEVTVDDDAHQDPWWLRATARRR